MLIQDDTLLVLVDVQGNLAQAMHEREILLRNTAILVEGCRTLDLPVLWTEQIPAKMGPTVAGLQPLLKGLTPFEKSAFSCCQEAGFNELVAATGRHHVLVAGIESHVCVYQTALDLLVAGYTVDIVADAVSSRCASNKHIALGAMRTAGAGIKTTEMCLFEIMRTARHDKFRDILRLVK